MACPRGAAAGASSPALAMRRRLKPYLYCLPIAAFAIGFVYYPFARTFLYSFCQVNFKGEITGFAGLSNYGAMLSKPLFQTALLNTLKLTCRNVTITLAVTLLTALLCQKKRPLSFLYETMFTLPMAVSMSAAAMIFKILLNPTVGYVNYALHLDYAWFTGRHTAMSGILALTVWMGVPFDFLLFLAALRSVPPQLLQAAAIDGAGYFRKLWRVQLPLISPTILYVACTNMVLALMTAGPVMIITQGGPSRSTATLIYMMYTSGYGSSNYSLAACVAIVTFCIAFVFTLIAFLAERGGVHYQ